MLLRALLITVIVCSIPAASPASEIPNPFVMNSGSAVSNGEQWEARRAEMIQHLLDGEYGRRLLMDT